MSVWLPRNKRTKHPDIFLSIGKQDALVSSSTRCSTYCKMQINQKQLHTARSFTSDSLLSTKRSVNSFSQLYIFTVLICAKSSPAQLILLMNTKLHGLQNHYYKKDNRRRYQVQSHHQAKFLFKNIILRKLYPKSNIFSTPTREKVNVYLSLLPVHFQQGQLAIICSLYILHSSSFVL